MKEQDEHICILAHQRCGAMTESFHCCFYNINICIPWRQNEIKLSFSQSCADQSNHACLVFSRDNKSSFLHQHFFVETLNWVHGSSSSLVVVVFDRRTVAYP
ncbi:hypothetical protein DPMN_052974 [Dreissena polymorpha]|uniref:Uncharacterized protein n=1 Tax=Dreissena polymorpha TaxID=45954 RepID=A0A9D4CLU8_DREPO|nr:hypothetical protein DPMN_052974 [Dreissena polymorpha]